MEKECKDCWHNYHCPMPQEGYDYNPKTCPWNPDNGIKPGPEDCAAVAEKAKAYDAAIKRAKEYREAHKMSFDYTECIETIFPELSESEDERIYRLIYSAIKNEMPIANADNREKAIAYLEKNKAQKLDEGIGKFIIDYLTELRKANSDNTDFDADCAEAIAYAVKIFKQTDGGEEDESNDEQYRHGYETGFYDAVKNFKLAEWSEEDKNGLTNTIALIQGYKDSSPKDEFAQENCNYCLDWLKSFRTKSHWKPSEEQMFALSNGILMAHNLKRGGDKVGLESLYSDLKKL